MADKSYQLSVLDVAWIRCGLSKLQDSLIRQQNKEVSKEGRDLRGREIEQVLAVLSRVKE